MGICLEIQKELYDGLIRDVSLGEISISEVKTVLWSEPYGSTSIGYC